MVSISTPKYLHLKEEDFMTIYEPAEDSFLLMDALEKDNEFIKKINPMLCLELGPGSGVIITFLATMLNKKGLFLASDVNRRAAYSTVKTGIENSIDINVTIDDMVASFLPRLQSKVDVLLFNPPYVVTPSEEVGGNALSASWAGGVNGREVIDEFLPTAMKLLSEEGVLYLLLLKENKPDEVISLMQKHGFVNTTLLCRKTGPEYLSVHRFSRHAISDIQSRLQLSKGLS